jgi:hypothetical protein
VILKYKPAKQQNNIGEIFGGIVENRGRMTG